MGLRQQRRLFAAWNVTEHEQRDNRVEGGMRERDARHVSADQLGSPETIARARAICASEMSTPV